MKTPRQLKPTDYAVPSLPVARALQAWRKGEATPEQQVLTFQWLMHAASKASSEVFQPGQPDTTAYLAGRRSVGLNIVWVLEQPVENFRTKGETDV